VCSVVDTGDCTVLDKVLTEQSDNREDDNNLVVEVTPVLLFLRFTVEQSNQWDLDQQHVIVGVGDRSERVHEHCYVEYLITSK
jgi:hypothetical protein